MDYLQKRTQTARALFLGMSLSAFITACEQGPEYYDRRGGGVRNAATPETNSNRNSGNNNAVNPGSSEGDSFDVIDSDPNDPCGATKAFGAKPQAFIVGGEAASQDDLVTQSTVKVILNGGHCTGTLIGPQHVLTAAHCFWNPQNGTPTIQRASQVSLGIGLSGNANANLTVDSVVIQPR